MGRHGEHTELDAGTIEQRDALPQTSTDDMLPVRRNVPWAPAPPSSSTSNRARPHGGRDCRVRRSASCARADGHRRSGGAPSGATGGRRKCARGRAHLGQAVSQPGQNAQHRLGHLDCHERHQHRDLGRARRRWAHSSAAEETHAAKADLARLPGPESLPGSAGTSPRHTRQTAPHTPPRHRPGQRRPRRGRRRRRVSRTQQHQQSAWPGGDTTSTGSRSHSRPTPCVTTVCLQPARGFRSRRARTTSCGTRRAIETSSRRPVRGPAAGQQPRHAAPARAAHTSAPTRHARPQHHTSPPTRQSAPHPGHGSPLCANCGSP